MSMPITSDDKKYLPLEDQRSFAGLFLIRKSLKGEQLEKYNRYVQVIETAKKADQQQPRIASSSLSPASSQTDTTSRLASLLTLPACDSSLFTDLRVISAALLVAGTVLLAASLIFSFGIVGVVVSALLLTGGVGVGGFKVYTHFTADPVPANK